MESIKSFSMTILCILTIVSVFIAMVFFSERPNDVKKYAEIEGWSSYKIEGVCWFGCAKGEFYQTKFTAVKNGKSFEGCVCSGLFFKNITLRIN